MTLPSSSAVTGATVGSGDQSYANQQSRSTTMQAWMTTGNQAKHIELCYKQALIEVTMHPVIPDPLFIDINYQTNALQNESWGGGSPSPSNMVNLNGSQLLNRINALRISAVRPLPRGVTFFSLPFGIGVRNSSWLYGQSSGIGHRMMLATGVLNDSKHVIITNNTFETNSYRREVPTHEAAHSLGLYHSFADGRSYNAYTHPYEDRVAVFSARTTENIMDYSNSGRSFFKWQWEELYRDQNVYI